MKRSYQSNITTQSLSSSPQPLPEEDRNPFYIDELRSLLLSLSVVRGVFHTYSALLCVSHRFYATTSSLIGDHFDRPSPTPDRTNLLLIKKELAYHFKGTTLALINHTVPYEAIDNDTLSHLTQLTDLDLTCNDRIYSDSLTQLTGLRRICLDNNKATSDWALSHMTGLTSLSLFNNKRIHSHTLLQLPFLTSLSLRNSELVRNDELGQMTGLRCLKLYMDDGWVLSETVARLTALEELDLALNRTVRGDALVNLTRLHTLNLWNNDMVDDYWLSQLTQLTSLCLDSNDKITDSGLSCLTGLRVLSMNSTTVYNDDDDNGISAHSLQQLTLLRDLSLVNVVGVYDSTTASYEKFKIASVVMRCLTALERLDLSTNGTDIELCHLTHLERMHLVYDALDETMEQRIEQFMSSSSYKTTRHDKVNHILEWER